MKEVKVQAQVRDALVVQKPMRKVQEKIFTNVPALNAASDIFFCMEQIQKRTACKHLKLIFAGGGRLNLLRLNVCVEVLKSRKGISLISFNNLDDYEQMMCYCRLYMRLSKLYIDKKRLTEALWKEVQNAVQLERLQYYTMDLVPIAELDSEKFKHMISL